MRNDSKWRWLPLLPGLAIGHTNAAPIEGELASNAAALLVVLGVWALLMGMRNLRELRHKRLVPERDPQRNRTNRLNTPDPGARG